MSNNKNRKNLLIKSETLRTLSSDALDGVAGGVATVLTVPPTVTKPTQLCPSQITFCQK